MKRVFEQNDDGTIRMNSVAVLSCGCGNTVPDARNRLRIAGVADVPIVMTSSHRFVKQYIRQVGLGTRVASLNKGTHSVLYNPFTGEYINLVKAPKTEQTYRNIYQVARSR